MPAMTAVRPRVPASAFPVRKWRLSGILEFVEEITAANISAGEKCLGTQIKWRYVLRTSALALVPIQVLVCLGALAVVLMDLPLDPVPPPSASFKLMSIVFAPPLETAIMIPLIYLITRVLERPGYTAAVSGALWGLVHGLAQPMAFLTAWPFFIFTLCFLSWRSSSLKQAYWYTVACHALYNATLCGLILCATAFS
jgi:hypothetical protein